MPKKGAPPRHPGAADFAFSIVLILFGAGVAILLIAIAIGNLP